MKILFISLGCDKNLSDSEEMLGLLTANGHEIVDSEEEADAIVINTCCFIHDAKEESVNTILEMAEYKEMFFRNSAISMNFRKTVAAELSPPEDISDTSRLPKAVISTVLTVSFHLSVVNFAAYRKNAF